MNIFRLATAKPSQNRREYIPVGLSSPSMARTFWFGFAVAGRSFFSAAPIEFPIATEVAPTIALTFELNLNARFS